MITCDKNVQKRNCIVLFKFNGKFNIVMTAVQVMQKLICTVLVVKHGEHGDHVKAAGHNIKWDHFDILAKGKTDYHCKIKETLYIQELEPAFNVNVGSEKLMLY